MTHFFRLIPLSVGALTLGAVFAFAIAAAPRPDGRSTQSPFYCDKSALSPEERTRHFDVLGPALIAKRQAVHELPDGYEFQFPADRRIFDQLAEFVEGERRCCPFFDISIRVTPERGPLWMRVTGRLGTKQFIQADGAEWLKPVG